MIDKPMTVNEWMMLLQLASDEAERLPDKSYEARQMHGLAMKVRARLDALREGRVMP